MEGPRYKPSWAVDGYEQFICRIGDVDIYYEPPNPRNREMVLIVGEVPRDSVMNYTILFLEEGTRLRVSLFADYVHIDLHTMCEIYRIMIEKGVLKDETEV